MLTAKLLDAMDADHLQNEIERAIAGRGANGGRLAYQATYDLSLALSLFEQAHDIASFVRVYFNPLTKGGYVAVDIRGIVEFPFTQLGQDDALAVCRAFLYAYRNQEKE